ncbi:MAG: hypothetical protein KBC69_00490 [Candidatus Magasanikbacteria bacterium]|nr:hypothetical protein [Candidatus Magasanikbacteria bacterium]
MESFLKIMAYIGLADTAVLVVVIIWGVIRWADGILPALLRLGHGLASREVAIFAKGNNLSSLKSLLLDSKLFKQKNIREITKIEDIGSSEGASVYLVFWSDWSNEITEILNQKPNECALIVYAPYNEGRIPDPQMIQLDGTRHTAVTNFRGRLLNDIVTSMITTSYEKK